MFYWLFTPIAYTEASTPQKEDKPHNKGQTIKSLLYCSCTLKQTGQEIGQMTGSLALDHDINTARREDS